MLQINSDAIQNGPTKTKQSKAAYDKYLMAGFMLIFALIGGFVLCAALAPIQGAVIAPGTVVVEGKPKTLQHLDG